MTVLTVAHTCPAYQISHAVSARIIDLLTARPSHRACSSPTPLGSAVPAAHNLAIRRAQTAQGRRDWSAAGRRRARPPRADVDKSAHHRLDGLRRWSAVTGAGRGCAQEWVSLTAATLLAIAAVMAEHADHAIRPPSPSRATIADTVGRDVPAHRGWRGACRESGWAVEAQRGHGSPTSQRGMASLA